MANAVLVNFAGGETSPKSRGRFDLGWFASSARKMLNFIAEVLGPARYRPGFRLVRLTRGGAIARLIPFQISNSIAYMLEFTAGYMRAYTVNPDGLTDDLVCTQPTTITAITKASPAVITVVSAAGLANGNEVIIKGMVGMGQLSNRQVKLAGGSGLTFQLVDPITGANLDSTAFDTYVSGGTVFLVSEIATPFVLAGDLVDLQYAQTEAGLEITSGKYDSQVVTVDAARVFTIGAPEYTNNPFQVGAAITVTGINAPHDASGFGTVINFAAGSTIKPDSLYKFTTVVGTVEINNQSYYLHQLITVDGSIQASIRTAAGANIDSSAWTAYASGGIATPAKECPIAVAFYEGRLGYFGTNLRPNAFFLSRSPDPTTGATRYHDFTGGTDADHACFFALAPVSGSVDYITWARGTTDFLVVGTFGGPYRVSGAGLDQPITPASINVRQFDSFGCEAAMPAGGSHIFFLQRGGVTLRAVRVINPYLGTMQTDDMCLNAEHISASAFQRVAYQQGRPNVLWVMRADGTLGAVTVNVTNQDAAISAGWHRHQITGAQAKVIDVQTLQRPTLNDKLWIVSERDFSGVKYRCVETMAEDVAFSDPEDFYTAPANALIDVAAMRNVTYRTQERYIHMDAAVTYNGSDRGLVAAATLSATATTGSAVTFNAGAAVFVASDVGKELWWKPNSTNGSGKGRATITAYVSATQVTAKITETFESTGSIPAGEWYFAVNKVYGLYHIIGGQVAIVADGAVLTDGWGVVTEYPIVSVASDGSVTLPASAVGAVIHAGFPYMGVLVSHNLEMGGKTGPAQSKPRNIAEMFIRFLGTLGVQYGTDMYRMQRIEQRDAASAMDRPATAFSGLRKLHYSDSWSQVDDGYEKRVVVLQRLPLPAVVQSVDVRYETSDEGE